MAGGRERMYFIGVTTASSSVMRLFPTWARLLYLDAEVVGRDLPLGAPAARVRDVVAEVASDATVRGALVTSHKLAVFDHAREMFADLDANARLCGEISCLSKRDGALVGHAKDPITAARALDDMLAADHFSTTGSDAMCLGAGGAGLAVSLALRSRPDAPRRIVLTDTDDWRLAAAEAVHTRLEGSTSVRLEPVADAARTDALVAALPPGSLVVNATGMGKDRPGSPTGPRVRFPERAVIWDLNYRGSLELLTQADAAAAERGLDVHDGWRYFLHGWAEHIAEVFDLELTDDRFAALVSAAEPARPVQS